MSTETKHTDEPLAVFGYRLFTKQRGHTVATTEYAHHQEAVKLANAERLALAWNCHDPLVNAARKVVCHWHTRQAGPAESQDYADARVELEAALALTRDH